MRRSLLRSLSLRYGLEPHGTHIDEREDSRLPVVGAAQRIYHHMERIVLEIINYSKRLTKRAGLSYDTYWWMLFGQSSIRDLEL
jgi:hypothetical protein